MFPLLISHKLRRGSWRHPAPWGPPSALKRDW